MSNYNPNLSDPAPKPDSLPSSAYAPVPIFSDITVKMMVGPRTVLSNDTDGQYRRATKLQDRTGVIKWHDTVVSILARLSVPTDGSMVMLRPGTPFPFGMADHPYMELLPRAGDIATQNKILEGVTVSIVPNHPDQVGPTAQPAQAIPAAPADVSSSYPKDMERKDSPDISVYGAAEERTAAATGYTVKAPVPMPVAATGNIHVLDPVQKDAATLSVAGQEIPPRPKILSFTADALTIEHGKAAHISWETEGAVRLQLSHAGDKTAGVEPVVVSSSMGSKGTRLVTPAETTVYGLVARNSVGEEVCSDLTITVIPAAPATAAPVIAAPAATPEPVAAEPEAPKESAS